MNILKPTYFDQFECIGGDCPLTCCGGWRIDIDKDTYAKYQNVPGEYGERLRTAINHKEKRFILNKNNECGMLDEEGYCDVYKQLGPESMCYTCRVYPRERRDCAELTQMSISLTCPEVARIVISSPEKIAYEYNETDTIEYKCSYETKKVKKHLYDTSFEALSTSIDLMQRKDVPLYHRLTAVLLYSNSIQTSLDKNKFNSLEQIHKNYQDENYLSKIFEEIGRFEVRDEFRSTLILDILESDIFFAMMYKYPATREIYEKYIQQTDLTNLFLFIKEVSPQFDAYMKDRAHEFENYYIHMIFESYMSTSNDGNLMKKVVINNIGLMLIKLAGMMYWYEHDKEFTTNDFAYLVAVYSRTLQKSKDRMDNIYRIFSNGRYNTMPYQMSLIKMDL